MTENELLVSGKLIYMPIGMYHNAEVKAGVHAIIGPFEEERSATLVETFKLMIDGYNTDPNMPYQRIYSKNEKVVAKYYEFKKDENHYNIYFEIYDSGEIRSKDYIIEATIRRRADLPQQNKASEQNYKQFKFYMRPIDRIPGDPDNPNNPDNPELSFWKKYKKPIIWAGAVCGSGVLIYVLKTKRKR
jgi:hypothetical protein